MSLLIVLGIIIAFCIYSGVESGKQKAPAIRDFEKFNHDTIGMSAKKLEKVYSLVDGKV